MIDFIYLTLLFFTGNWLGEMTAKTFDLKRALCFTLLQVTAMVVCAWHWGH